MDEENRSGQSTNRFYKSLSGFTSRILSFPIFLKIMGIGFLVAILFGSVTLIQTRSGTLRILTRILEREAMTTAAILADSIQDSASTGDTPLILEQLERAREIYPEISYILVRNPEGWVMASIFKETAPPDISDELMTDCPPDCGVRSYENSSGTIYEARAAILEGEAGSIQVGFTDEIVSRELKSFTGTILWGLLLCIAVGACLALLLTIILTRPIHHLVESANRIREGEFESRANIYSNDEIGRLAVAFNQMVEALSRYRKEVQAKEQARVSLIERIVQVQEDERKSISRELHDHLGQTLMATLLKAQSARDQGDLPDSIYQGVEKSIREATDEIHRIAWGMRPSILDDYGLDSALARHIEEASRHLELQIDYSYSSPPDAQRLPGRIEVCLYRIAQEAITNIQRHAEASHASVIVLQRVQDITLLVEDNGRGFDLSILDEKRDKCLGLIGMKERVALLGGNVAIESVAGVGTTIRVIIPLEGGLDGHTHTDS